MFYFSKARYKRRIQCGQNKDFTTYDNATMCCFGQCCKYDWNSVANEFTKTAEQEGTNLRHGRKINQHFVQTIIIWDQLWLKDNRSVFPSQNNVKLWHCFLPWNMKLWQMQMQPQPCWSRSVSLFISSSVLPPSFESLCLCRGEPGNPSREMKSESNPLSLSGLCCCSPPLGTSPSFGSFDLFRASSSPSSCRRCACTSWNKRSEKPKNNPQQEDWPPFIHAQLLTHLLVTLSSVISALLQGSV